MSTLSTPLRLLALAGAVLMAAPKGKGKGRPAWLEPSRDGVRVGDCPYCDRRVVIGHDEGLPVCLDLVVVSSLWQELGLLLRGIVCYQVRRWDTKLLAQLRDQWTISRGIPARGVVLPWHQCRAGKWRWSA